MRISVTYFANSVRDTKYHKRFSIVALCDGMTFHKGHHK